MKVIDVKKRLKKRLKEMFSLQNSLFIVLFVVLLIYAISFIVLFGWGFLTSLKNDGEFIMNKLSFPENWRFNNYVDVFNAMYVDITPEGSLDTLRYNAVNLVTNSLLYTIGCTFFATMTPCIVAFCCAKCKYKAINRIIETAVIIVMIVPIIGQTPARLSIAKTFGWYNQMWGIWIMNIAFTNMYFLVFLAAFKAMDKGYAEAAFIDGAGWFTIFFKIYLPLVSTTIGAVALLQFIGYWNAYETSMIFIPNQPTLALGLFWFKWNSPPGFKGIPYQIVACYILLLPMLLIFIAFRKKLMGNLTMGGLKG